MSRNIAGIIAEYNPFHNGHAFHIQETKRLCNASSCVVVMSGDFVQRGAPAVYDKYTRTRMALLSGADLVLELPPCFAVSSAEDFAACGVSLLDRLGIISHLCFGSECGDIALLSHLASLLAQEPKELSRMIKHHLSSGLSYPQARELALNAYLRLHDSLSLPAAVLSSPNNTLGIEYCKALLRRNSSVIPVTLKRTGAGYHDKELSCQFSSATALRKIILEEYSSYHRPASAKTSEVRPPRSAAGQVPYSCLPLMDAAVPLTSNDFSAILSYRLLELKLKDVPFQQFSDISPDLAGRMAKRFLDFSSFEDRIAALKTRQYTYTRISRCLMHLLLHITDEEIRTRKAQDYVSYIRVLGFRKESAWLLGEIKKASELPIITKTADAPDRLSENALSQFHRDLFCSHVYQSVLEQKSQIRPRNEYTSSPVIV